MKATKPSNNSQKSFRVPNSLLQGLTTTTTTQLNKLGVFPTTTLLGLMSLVDAKRPEREVRVKISTILEIIEVSKTVTKIVERKWTTAEGETRQKQYKAKRYSPKHTKMVNDALLELHDQTVVVYRKGEKRGVKVENRTVHVLDMFGYYYGYNGHDVDVDDLPEGREKVNVGTQKRPVWRIRRCDKDREQDERPAGVLFRLNKELAEEITGSKQTISYTLVAKRVFGMLKEIRNDPAKVRLVLLTLRQCNSKFVRRLRKLIRELGWDPSHPQRALAALRKALDDMQEKELITRYEIDEPGDRLRITHNKEWHKQS